MMYYRLVFKNVGLSEFVVTVLKGVLKSVFKLLLICGFDVHLIICFNLFLQLTLAVVKSAH